MGERSEAECRADQRVLIEAKARLAAGKKLTLEQKRAQRRVEKDLRWEHYRTIPKRDWVEMSGRPVKVLNEQAQTHKIPFDGATVNLPDVVRALHDFLYRQRYILRAKDGDPLLEGSNGRETPAQRRYRNACADLRELDVEERRERLVDRDEIHAKVAVAFGIIRDAGARLQRKFGVDAHDILDEAIVDAMRELGGSHE